MLQGRKKGRREILTHDHDKCAADVWTRNNLGVQLVPVPEKGGAISWVHFWREVAGAGAKCAAVPWLEAAHTQAGFLDVIYVLMLKIVN